MKQNYFSNKLLKLFYSELDLFQRLETEYAISQDIAIQNEWDEMSKELNEMSKLSYAPSQKSLDSIITYSKL